MLLSKHAMRDSKKAKFVKQQKSSGILSSLSIKVSLNKIPLLGPFFLIV